MNTNGICLTALLFPGWRWMETGSSEQAASPGGGGADAAYELPNTGEVVHGFQVTARGNIDSLNAQTASFLHVSGQRKRAIS